MVIETAAACAYRSEMTCRLIQTHKILLTAGSVCVLMFALVAPARGETPSVDAYAGQALVLGNPHQAHSQVRPGGRGNTGSARGAGQGEATAGRESSSEPSAGSGSSSGNGPAGGASQAPAAQAHGNVSPPDGAAGHAALPGSATRPGTGGSAGTTGGSSPRRLILTAAPASSSLPLDGLDLWMLVAGLLLLLGTAVTLRCTRASA